MTADGRHAQGRSGQVIETASATTSPDNSQSGNFAYVIAGIVLVLSLLFGMGIAGCMSLASEFLLNEYSNEPSYHEPTYPFEDYEQYFDDYLDDIEYFDEKDYPLQDNGNRT